MSTISSLADGSYAARSSGLVAILGAFQRGWVAYINWRMEHAAIAMLRAMSDHDLNDLGLGRSEMAAAVKGRRDMTAQL